MPSWSGEIAVRALGRAEAHALRAELFHFSPGGGTLQQREQNAQAELSFSLGADPGNPLALQLQRDSNGEAAVAAHPDDWRSWLLFADRHHDDSSALRKAVQLAPENAGVLYRLALAEQNASQPKEALRDAAHAAEISPGRPDVLDGLAQVYAANGRCDEAQQTAQRAFAALPDSATTEAPASLKKRLNDIVAGCGGQSSLSRRVLLPPTLRACSRRVPSVRSNSDNVTAAFTIGEDGAVSGVSVSGQGSEALKAAVKKYMESCTFEPVVYEGKKQSLQSTLQFRAR
jgi:tetratricopeptide (TPR) repeat protein